MVNLNSFFTTPLSTVHLDNLYIRQPVQFQYAMNVINMYNMKYGMPLNVDEYKTKQQELVDEFNKTVVLVTGFEEV